MVVYGSYSFVPNYCLTHTKFGAPGTVENQERPGTVMLQFHGKKPSSMTNAETSMVN
jgi:hypothetical protein